MKIKGLKVLIVDDEPIVALDLAFCFEHAGASILRAVSEEHALKIIANIPIEACVLDYKIWNGATSHRIAHALQSASVPFVVISGSSASHEGAIAHFRKPADPFAIIEMFEEHRVG